MVNNREHLFRRRQAIAIFCQVFGEARERFTFELRGFRLEEEWLSFYIKSADGLQLPAIVQWVKQTFTVRFNRREGRTGHVWGDLYWSRVLEGEPPEEAVEVDWEAVDVGAETGEISFRPRPPDGVSPPSAENPAEGGFSPKTSPTPRDVTGSTTPRNAVRQRQRVRSAQLSSPTAFQKANASALAHFLSL